jgi:hypothetical protein
VVIQAEPRQIVFDAVCSAVVQVRNLPFPLAGVTVEVKAQSATAAAFGEDNLLDLRRRRFSAGLLGHFS